MSVITVLPLASYIAGSYPVGPVAISDGLSSLTIAVQWQTTADLTVWPLLTDTITFDLQFSPDGGVTWRQWNNGSAGGGLHVNNKTGLQLPLLYIQGQLPAGSNRQMRATITLSATIKTAATITVV